MSAAISYWFDFEPTILFAGQHYGWAQIEAHATIERASDGVWEVTGIALDGMRRDASHKLVKQLLPIDENHPFWAGLLEAATAKIEGALADHEDDPAATRADYANDLAKEMA